MTLPLFRVGQGFDAHALVEGRPLTIGGVCIPHPRGLQGHSDADVLVHAIIDALLGAAGLGNIGEQFPDQDSRYAGANSCGLLLNVAQRVRAPGWHIANIDATVIAQAPKLASYFPLMVECLAAHLTLSIDAINIKAKTTEGLGFCGREEGIAAQAICLLMQSPRPSSP